VKRCSRKIEIAHGSEKGSALVVVLGVLVIIALLTSSIVVL